MAGWCAACLHQLRVGVGGNGLPYYRDTSVDRELPCPAMGNLTVRSSLVFIEFGEVLRSIELPASWCEAIAERCSAEANQEDDENGCIRKRRAVELQRSEIKLTPEQLEKMDVSQAFHVISLVRFR